MDASTGAAASVAAPAPCHAGQPACSPPRWTCTSHSSADSQGSGSQDHGAAACRHAARLDTCGWRPAQGRGHVLSMVSGTGRAADQGGLPGALVPPRRAVLPDRWRWRAAVPLERCRAGAAASMTTQPVSTLSTSHTGHPCLTRGGQLPALWEYSCIRPRKGSSVCASRAPHPL